MTEIKNIIGENLTHLRLEKKWTQEDLAKKLNYTDKSVSKWENGDATPPIDTLKELADMYGVTVDYLITENHDEYISKSKEDSTNKIIITLLSTLLVWMVSTMLYVYSLTIHHISNWQIFIYALPVSCIVLLVFNGIWGKRKYAFIITSILVWSILTSIFIIYLNELPWAIFFLGAPLQIAIILWSKLKATKK